MRSPAIEVKLLACVDGSPWSIEALCDLAERRHPADEILVLHVVLGASEGYLESGRVLLEAALRRSRLRAEDPGVRCRLEVGDPTNRILAVCREERPDVVAMGFVGADGFPQLSQPGRIVQAVWAGYASPVLIASPCGIEILAGRERVLTIPVHTRESAMGGSNARYW